MTTSKKVTCPECGAKYNTAKGLGYHRRLAHNVVGSAKSSMETQRKRRLYLASFRRSAEGLLLCPECGIGFGERSLSLHRRLKHGLSAEQQQEMAEAKPKPKPAEAVAEVMPADPNRCPECEFVAVNPRGLIRHKATHNAKPTPEALRKRNERKNKIDSPTQAIVLAETNGNAHHHAEAHPAADGHPLIPDAALAVALGRFQGLCASFAAEYDLPPRMFAARLAELIYNTQVRQASRAGVRLPTL